MHQGASTVEISIAELRALVNCSKPYLPFEQSLLTQLRLRDLLNLERVPSLQGPPWQGVGPLPSSGASPALVLV
jgi:hypothetical protein